MALNISLILLKSMILFFFPTIRSSNGLAEKSIQIAKRIFQNAKLDGHDPYLGILEYRTTPSEVGYSSAELLQGTQLRSILVIN